MLPFVDEHTTDVAAARARTWAALERHVQRLVNARSDPFRRLLGTDPPAGFAVSSSVPQQRIELAGGHRFSRYRLVFEITDAQPARTRVHARTFAAFPGPQGRIYRALVIGSRLHVLATRHMLREIRCAAEEPSGD